ncbi:hypothetical protein BpHYR1_049154 [Brachionus plicatilis]|uniref:Uncharacterized protein n=1 Tax=Brachionus plicatilis TaxID=10195 RepID=A0A3M7QRM6_BRAPC|nr:hypothetical protein BpHYR1_049154 [Brachionus plicatilis]
MEEEKEEDTRNYKTLQTYKMPFKIEAKLLTLVLDWLLLLDMFKREENDAFKLSVWSELMALVNRLEARLL